MTSTGSENEPQSAPYEPPKVEDIAGGDRPLAAAPGQNFVLPVTGQ